MHDLEARTWCDLAQQALPAGASKGFQDALRCRMLCVPEKAREILWRLDSDFRAGRGHHVLEELRADALFGRAELVEDAIDVDLCKPSDRFTHVTFGSYTREATQGLDRHGIPLAIGDVFLP